MPRGFWGGRGSSWGILLVHVVVVDMIIVIIIAITIIFYCY